MKSPLGPIKKRPFVGVVMYYESESKGMEGCCVFSSSEYTTNPLELQTVSCFSIISV